MRRIKESKKTTPEGAIKKAVKQYLTLQGWFIFPILQGLGAFKGISDFIAVKNGRVLFLEIKTPMGTLSENQQRFGTQIKDNRGEYIVIRSVDDLMGNNL